METGHEEEGVGRRAVELGILDPARAEAALHEYRAKRPQLAFTSFLLERGLINVDQAGALSPEAVQGFTTIGPADPLIGQTCSGCVVERKLGQGGMGSVYLARREEDGARVVVKFLAAEQATNPSWRSRFEREARMMQRIAHPNIVAIYALDVDCARPHMVMELVEGQGLDERLERDGPLPPAEVTRIGRDIALGLAEAHRNGVVHRDIKPANVLLGRGGEVKILDFGLAKNVEADDGLSMPGQILGTPHYMAPEQWGDHGVDARCDLFSLGAMLYHLVTGALPFPGRTPTAISRKVMAGKFDPPRALVPSIGEDLELAISRLLTVDRRFRYQDAAAVAEDLDRVLQGKPVRVPCLVETGGKRKGQRYPLLPGSQFTIGRADESEVVIADPSVSRQHAVIERGATGYVLRDLGSSYGTFVSDMRIREVVLKDGDPVKLGRVQFEFQDGGLSQSISSTRRVSPTQLQVTTVPIPFLRALADLSDRRVVVALLEQLAPDTTAGRVARARARLRELLGGEVAERIGTRVEAALNRERARLPALLFAITHENLGDDLPAWLGWWDQTRSSYPKQLAPDLPVPRFVLRYRAGEDGAGEERRLRLDGAPVLPVGRDPDSKVLLEDRSVSRLHATILRFHQRLVIRDEGSRFGTLLNGDRVRLAFLSPDDRITLGKVELVVEEEPLDPTPPTRGGGSSTQIGHATYPVLAEAFFALAEEKHLAAATGLARLLELEQWSDWLEKEAGGLFLVRERSANLAQAVQKYYARQAKLARAALPAMLGQDAGDDPLAWRDLIAGREDLPPQVVPAGWLPRG